MIGLKKSNDKAVKAVQLFVLKLTKLTEIKPVEMLSTKAKLSPRALLQPLPASHKQNIQHSRKEYSWLSTAGLQ